MAHSGIHQGLMCSLAAAQPSNSFGVAVEIKGFALQLFSRGAKPFGFIAGFLSLVYLYDAV